MELKVPYNEIEKGSIIQMAVTATSGIQKIELRMGNKVLYSKMEDGKQSFSISSFPDIFNVSNLDFGPSLQLILEVTSSVGTIKSVSQMVTSYCIGNYDGFMKFSRNVNKGITYEGKRIYLLNDIYTEGQWIPVGYIDNVDNMSGAYFGGTFLAYGHKINFNTPYYDSVKDGRGIFGYVKGGVIDGLTVSGNMKNMESDEAEACGGIVGFLMNGTIRSCHTDNASIDCSAGEKVGGIVRYC